jgi:NADH dehydrogenase
MKRIVILGGGFGGLEAAQHLDRAFRDDKEVDIVLVSNTNYLVYTPMLADVAGGSLDPRDAVPALRAFLKKVRFFEATVQHIDVARQTVQGIRLDGTSDEISYDYLLIALGAVTSFAHATGAAEYSIGFKDLFDAIRVHNRALTLLEWAATVRDADLRRELLTFVVAGGGFSGVEGIAALEDLLHRALRYYPAIKRDELRFILAPHGSRLLEQIDARLGVYAAQKLMGRGVEVRLGVGVSAITARSATLTTGEVIPTRTVIWTGGIRVNPVLHTVELPTDTHGALQVSGKLQVVDHPTIFALGDCAAVPLPGGNGFYASTAQNAIRQGALAGANIAALVRSSSSWPARLKTFDYKPIGALASLGKRQAVAQIGNLHLAGLVAWFAWRGIYLAKLPTMTARVRVGLAWMLEMFAPVNLVQLPMIRENIPAFLAELSGMGVTPKAALPASPASSTNAVRSSPPASSAGGQTATS